MEGASSEAASAAASELASVRRNENKIEVVGADGTVLYSTSATPPLWLFETSPERLQLLRTLRFRDDDVVLATFPKCGTTLCEEIVLLLRNGGDASKMNPAGKNTWEASSGVGKIWPEVNIHSAARKAQAEGAERVVPRSGNATHDEMDLVLTPEEFDAVAGPRLLKSHFNGADLFKVFPGLKDSNAKIITMLREPVSAFTSAFHFFTKFLQPPVTTVEVAMPLFLSGAMMEAAAQPWGRLSDAVLTFQALQQADPSRTLVLSYEGFLADPAATVLQIATHIGVAAPPELVDKIVAALHFDNMKERSGGAHHIRRGKAGDVDELMTEAERRLLVETHDAQVKAGVVQSHAML